MSNTDQLPFSEEIELSILASIVKNPAILDEVAFRDKMFYIPANLLAFQHLADVFSEYGEIDWHIFLDTFSVRELAEVGGVQNLNRIWDFASTAMAWQSYYEQLRELYQRREGWKLLTHLAGKLLDKHFDFGSQMVQDAIETGLSGLCMDQPVTDLPVETEMIEALRLILERRPGHGMIEVSSIRSLNLAIGCLLPGDEVVIGAETSFGKTSLAMHFVSHLCFGHQKKKVAVFSMEMRKQSIFERMFASMASVPLENIRRNDLTDDQVGKIKSFIGSIPKGHYVFMDDSPTLDIRSIVSRCRRLKKKYGLDAVVVDYLQLVSPANLRSNVNRQQEVADISRRLKMLAVELDVVVVALSQLNDAGQLRESRAIGQDADIVMFIRDPAKSDDSFEKTIVIDKNRNGPRGQPVSVHFYPQYVSFGDKTP